MKRFSRRDVLAGAATLAGGLLLSKSFPVLAAPGVDGSTRYDVSSKEGKAMLEIYAQAVAKMNDKTLYPEGSPLNWGFQWFTHYVPDNTTKEKEIARIYPNGGAYKNLAERMWDTCQSHDGQREDFFLPWHRMYVSYFEQIIRQVSGNPKFTLPYWDYTDPKKQAIPEEFRKPGDPVWGSLYRSTRWPNVNAGGNVTQSDNGNGGAALTLSCMTSNIYSKSQTDAGFCANLDQEPHGALHDDVGNDQGMASIQWAANDPVFWIHHSNVDRIWASWNFAGGKNPDDEAFLNQTFVFSSTTGKPVIATVKDFLSVPKTAYAAYAKRPVGSLAFEKNHKALLTKNLSMLVSSSAADVSQPVMLGDKAVTVDLTSTQSTQLKSSAGNQLFSADLAKAEVKNPTRVFLRFEGLTAQGAVNGIYNVFVHGDVAGELSTKSAAFVGQVNFFGALGSHQHDVGTAAVGFVPHPKVYSILLRSATRKMLAGAKISTPKVTLVPVSKVNAAAMPMIQKISFVVG
jgi:tyrosinase